MCLKKKRLPKTNRKTEHEAKVSFFFFFFFFNLNPSCSSRLVDHKGQITCINVDTQYIGTLLPLYGISYYNDIGWKYVTICVFHIALVNTVTFFCNRIDLI